jgi:hypothetical protein
MKPFGRLRRTSCTSPETALTCGANAASHAPGTRNELRRPSMRISIGVKTGSWKSAIVPAKSSKGPLPLALPEKMRASASRCAGDAESAI